ncbi:hypothetical protein B4064_0405 [Caldibacillus thermoamylovorans]|uniref:hypothetical protein n=1 Tax=Bacillaceae TaxID=186817 RepID=UPI0005A4BC5D|nr:MULTISPECIES: hypothetical protein [Bacillaceae]KIO62931.1 hypothetical protein B4064_0405 [Caldibacillus thermoamylovorans]KIO67544.1 hypothetical protein B4065_0426 [Caldibacillus thermoamylovorans]MED3644533.1 hypothetical protein [Caldifermentibacillus hisashii]
MKFLKKVLDKQNEGSIYLEILLAFFVWLVILSTVIPSFLHLTLARKEILIEHMGNQILSRQVQKVIYDQPIEASIQQEGYPAYYTVVQENMEGMKEICVYYKSMENEEKHVCRTINNQ